MTQKDIYKEEFKNEQNRIKQEKEEELRRQAKYEINKLLTRKESLKEQKNKIDEELRLVDADLDDMKNGRYESLKERHNEPEINKSININIDFIINAMRELERDFWKGTYKIQRPYIDPYYPICISGSNALTTNTTNTITGGCTVVNTSSVAPLSTKTSVYTFRTL